ncbi:MAG TPA: hypothetical protein VIC85_15640 [Ktedonobacterales bacterium]|jgi:hypothetical protein
MRATSADAGTGVALSGAFARFAGVGGLITGVSSVLYAVFFLLVKGQPHAVLPPLLLAIGGFFATAVTVAVYNRVRDADPIFALWALGLGLIGQLGATIHGVYGLALLNPAPAGAPNLTGLPNPLDPAGFLAFGVVGVSVFVFGWLIVRGGGLPRNLGYLGLVLGVLLVALFLGALLAQSATSPFILVPGGLASLLATPIWNICLGLIFLRARG